MSKTAEALEVRCNCEDAEVTDVSEVSHGDFKYEIGYPGQSILMLDFEPLVERISEDGSLYSLKTSIVMLHWQAIPKGFRRWGFFYMSKDGTTAGYKVADTVYFGEGRTIQLDENIHKTLPTSVLLFRGVVPVLEHDGMRTIYRLKAE